MWGSKFCGGGGVLELLCAERGLMLYRTVQYICWRALYHEGSGRSCCIVLMLRGGGAVRGKVGEGVL